MSNYKHPLRVGVGGPVGSGKTALLEALCKAMRSSYQLAVVTNDIYTKEDQRILTEAGALEPERIVGVETGGCPHTAIREDASMNLAAVEALSEKFGNLDLIFVESGGDNLSATFSPELADLTIYVIDVAEGEKIPRKGGPGITKSDFLVINKTDLAPYVGASLEVMERDTLRMRGERPWTFSNLKSGEGLEKLSRFWKRKECCGCSESYRRAADSPDPAYGFISPVNAAPPGKKTYAAGNSTSGQRGRTVTPRSAVAPALKRTMPA